MPQKKIGRVLLLDTDSLKSKQDLYNFLKSLEGKFSIQIDTYQALISTAQRAYYWGYLLSEFALLTGEEKDVWHKRFKKWFLKVDVQVGNKRVEKIRSTTSLSTIEAEEYYSAIRRYGWEKYQLSLRLPGEYGPLTTIIT